jgi:hypothetical protein
MNSSQPYNRRLPAKDDTSSRYAQLRRAPFAPMQQIDILSNY